MSPLALCYHAVSDGWADPLAMRPSDFERQLRLLLRRGFRPVGAAEFAQGGGRVLHITFDDAYRSVADNAVPILERLGMPATIFACTRFAAAGAAFEVPELAEQLAANRDEMQTLQWERLRELADRGVEIGSHTVSHPHLTETSDADLEEELAGSRSEIEDNLGRRCRYLAYPFGHDDPRVHRAAAAAGYEAAFTLADTPHASRENLFALPRVDLYRADGVVRSTLKTSLVKPLVTPLMQRWRSSGRRYR